MKRLAWTRLIAVMAFVLFWPVVALADNCGSLSDCWDTAGAAGAAAAGAGAAGAAGGWGGGEGEGGDDDGDGNGGPDLPPVDDGVPDDNPPDPCAD